MKRKGFRRRYARRGKRIRSIYVSRGGIRL